MRSTPFLVLAALAVPGALAAQGSAALAPADARVALLPAALYTEQANVQEASDAAKAGVATAVLAERLAAQLGPQLVAGADVARLAGAAGNACNVRVACAREVGRRAGAQWVVLSKVSKTSNLIWLLTGQLVHVPSGRIVLDDSTELKGEPEAMTRIGARSFADRVARTVQRGGRVTDYPNGEPAYVGPNGATP